MISIKLGNDILEKHKEYICNANIEKKINLLSKESEFKKIYKFFNKLSYDFLQQHEKFCNYILMEIKKVKDGQDLDSSLFLGKPIILNEKIKCIENEYPLVCEKFKSTKEEDQDYSNIILDSFTYEDFSLSNEMLIFEEEKIFKEATKANLSEELKMIKNCDGEHKYNAYHYIKFKRNIKTRINEQISRSADEEIVNLFNKLIKQIDEVKINCSYKNFINNIYDKIQEVYNEFNIYRYNYKIIGIENYRELKKKNRIKNDKWNAYHFIFELGLKVCPYCNRQFITPIYWSEGKVRADLDHFFSKARYPYLSISIYNLVPCCKFCNSSLKGTKEFNYDEYVNPYEKSIDDILKFDYIPSSIKSFSGKDDIKIILTKKNNIISSQYLNKANNMVKVFNILELYNYHKDVVINLIYKRAIYSDTYIDSLVNNFSGLLNSREEAIELLIGKVNETKIKDTCLGKLTNDIVEKLDFK